MIMNKTVRIVTTGVKLAALSVDNTTSKMITSVSTVEDIKEKAVSVLVKGIGAGFIHGAQQALGLEDSMADFALDGFKLGLIGSIGFTTIGVFNDAKDNFKKLDDETVKEYIKMQDAKLEVLKAREKADTEELKGFREKFSSEENLAEIEILD
jgi:hypothetical protein